MQHVARVGIIFSLLCAGLTASGCAAPAGPVIDQGHVHLALAPDWKATDNHGDRWSISYARAEGNQELLVAPEFNEQPGAKGALTELDLRDAPSVDNYVATSTTEIKIDGAYDAIERRFTYTKDGAPKQGVWIVMSQWPYPKTAVVSLAGDRIDDVDVQTLKKNLRFKKIVL